MTAQVRPQHSEWHDTMIEAMRAELDWAPMTFPSWAAYERARPLVSGETCEIIGHFPQHGYILQYRPLLGELTESNRMPIDQQPEVAVRGSVKAAHLAQLRRLDQRDDPHRIKDYIDHIVQPTYTLPTREPIRTGSPIPEHSHLYPEYEINPTEPESDVGTLPEQAASAYRTAGDWRLRISTPVDATPTGELVFEPLGFNNGERIEETLLVFRTRATQAQTSPEAILLRPEGLGRWRQTATLTDPRELPRAAPDEAPIGRPAMLREAFDSPPRRQQRWTR